MSSVRFPVNKTLREVLASLKNHKKHTRNIELFLACFSDRDIVRLITTSKEVSATLIAFPLNHFRFFMAENSKLLSETNLLFHCVRDYLLLKQMQHLLKDEKKPFGTQQAIIEKLTSAKLVFESKATFSAPNSHTTWKKLLTANRRQTIKDTESARASVIKRLHELKIPDSDKQMDKIQGHVAHHTSIVTAFPMDKMGDLTSARLVNYFSVKNRWKTSETFNGDSYYWGRLSTETLHFQTASPDVLMAMSLDPTAHPCYATLQFNSNIYHLSNYGESFIVFQPSLNRLVCASAGPGFLNKNRYYTIDDEQYLAPLIAGFSDNLLTACANTDSKTDTLKNVYLKDSSAFIEVLLPSNISLTDPTYVRHLHLGDSGNFPLSIIDEFKKRGITVSAGHNPFTDTEFSAAYYTNQLDNFLTQYVVKNIERAILHIGETTSKFVQVKFDYRTLQLTMKIHANNALFHQAQGAAILYLLGVQEYFKTTPALKFHRGERNPEFQYTLTLNGMARKEGKLTDQDAYTCEYDSLRVLLGHLLKRIFSIALVSKQNADHLTKYNKPHPVTGKGATEESNQTQPLHLGDEKESYDISVNWVFDMTEIEVISKQETHVQFVHDTLKGLGLPIIRQNNRLRLGMPLMDIFAELEKRQFHYQATVVYEDQGENHGCVLLAFRNGYTTQGGHNPNPYYHRGIEEEFGELISDVTMINNAKRMIGDTSNPRTLYTSLPARCYRNIYPDPSEFKVGSLDRFAVYEMGNLNSHQLHNAARMLEMSQEIYEKSFDKALLLRPLPALFLYLQDCEKTLLDLLKNIIGLTYEINIQIRQGKETVLVGRRQYWKPEQDFGKIEITASVNIINSIINYFEAEFSQKYTIERRSPTSIRFININPFELIKVFEAAPKKFVAFSKKTFVDLVKTHQKEVKTQKTVLTKSSNLDHYSTIKKAEKILMAAEYGIKMDSFLGIRGVKYLNEFLLALDDKKQQPDAKLENSITPEQRNMLTRAIDVICQEAQDWCYATLLYYALREGLLPSIKFLIENKHCDPRKISEEWTARSYVDFLYRGADNAVRTYIHQICPYDRRDWFLRFNFYFHTPSNQVRGRPKIIRDYDTGETCEVDPTDELDNDCKAIPVTAVEEVLQKTFETTPPLLWLHYKSIEVDVELTDPVTGNRTGEITTQRSLDVLFSDMRNNRVIDDNRRFGF